MKKLIHLALLITISVSFSACGRDGAPKPIPYENKQSNEQK